MPSSEKPIVGGNKLLKIGDERIKLLSLLKEAADTVHAAIIEKDISDDRRNYRIYLEQRIREALVEAKHKE
jgi:hypothetical protein